MSIKIYSTKTCSYCKKAKELFNKYGAKYEEIDISENETAREELIRKTGFQHVPVIEIDGIIYPGFNPNKLQVIFELDSYLKIK